MSAHAAIRAAEVQGRSDAGRVVSRQLALSACGMGSFSAGSRPIALSLLRMLLALRIPCVWLLAVRTIVPGRRVAAFDRFARKYAYWTGVRRGLKSPGATVEREPAGALWRGLLHAPRILMYHAVAMNGETPSCYVVSRRAFARQLRCLRWLGYRVISLADLGAHLKEGRVPPAHSIVITFDDGFADNAVGALPVLQRHRHLATVFVVSDGIGQRAWWPQSGPLQGRQLLTGVQLLAMKRAGIEIGAHTRSHPSLAQLPPDLMEHEISGARAALTQQLNAPVRSFAYPFGDLSPSARAEVQRAGYDVACCSRSGVVDPSAPLFALPRIEVRGTDSLIDFALMLWRGHRRSPDRPHGSLQRAPA